MLGLPYAALISVIIGVTNVIPFFGPFLGAIPSTLLILFIDPIHALYFVIFVCIFRCLITFRNGIVAHIYRQIMDADIRSRY